MIDYFETKEHPVTRKMVLEAFRKVKANRGSAGVDGQSIEAYELKLQENTYKLWNRMSAGSYFPSPVKEVEIAKKSGGIRKLGIPTVQDRIAQQVVKAHLEPKIDSTFHNDSYGYRRGKNAHQAIQSAMKRSDRIAWVIDLDIKGFFDNIDHELMMKGVRYYTKEKWVIMYIERWLKAKVRKVNGELNQRDKGTPQGGVISALIANVFLHFVFDRWIDKMYPNIRFERYCDDIIIHCISYKQALFIKGKVEDRMHECKLELNESKTKVVYCRNEKHRESYANVSYDFLGYTIRPSFCPTGNGLKLLSVACMSRASKKEVNDKIRKMSIRKFRGNIQSLAKAINSKIRGWIYYYCRFHKWTTFDIWRNLNQKLISWVRSNKRIGKRKAISWLNCVYMTQPSLFAHWQMAPPSKVCR
jgi:group II intron reverse transcriptase/maturase